MQTDKINLPNLFEQMVGRRMCFMSWKCNMLHTLYYVLHTHAPKLTRSLTQSFFLLLLLLLLMSPLFWCSFARSSHTLTLEFFFVYFILFLSNFVLVFYYCMPLLWCCCFTWNLCELFIELLHCLWNSSLCVHHFDVSSSNSSFHMIWKKSIYFFIAELE